MPHGSIAEAKEAGAVTKIDDAPLSLAQINEIGEMGDAIEAKGGAEAPFAVAIANFKKTHRKEGNKWVKKEAEKMAEEFPETEIFRAGDYGSKGVYTEDDLDQIAADYDPSVHEAPITLDHHDEGPAFGWVQSLRRIGDKLFAKFSHVSANLKEMIKTGAYKKRSVEIYTDFQGQLGHKYLRAVTFLGAKIPHVKGLTDMTFADYGPAMVFEYEGDDGKKKHYGGRAMDDVKKDAPNTPVIQQFTEAQVKDLIDAAVVAQKKQFDEVLGAVKSEVLIERLKREALEGLTRRTDIHQFCEDQKRQGRFLPAWQALGIEVFMEHLETMEKVVKFGEAEKSLGSWFRGFMAAMPDFIKFGETHGVDWKTEKAEKTPAEALDERTMVFMNERKCTYAEALAEVSRQDKLLAYDFMTEQGYHFKR